MKKITATLAAMAIVAVSQAQIQSAENKLIAESAGGSLLVVEQTYKVKDRNAELYYGFKGSNIFGRTFSVAVRLKNGLCYTDAFVRPWVGDANYAQYETGYLPVYAGAQFKYVADSALRGFPFDSVGCRRTESPLVYTTTKTPFNSQGLEPDSLTGAKRGWLLWVVSDDTVHRTDSLVIDVRACNITASDTMLYHKVNQPNRQMILSSKKYSNVLGGIFVTPRHTALGEVQFMLTGVLVEKDGLWQLVTPFVGQLKQPSTPTGGLTPINNESATPSNSNKLKKKR
ncbi:MAG: hypothetical protein IKW86_03170 [Salinivirgaceae bacterium]|nr:hypothetical protein [Salinivirgaceae bacterium]